MTLAIQVKHNQPSVTGVRLSVQRKGTNEPPTIVKPGDTLDIHVWENGGLEIAELFVFTVSDKEYTSKQSSHFASDILAMAGYTLTGENMLCSGVTEYAPQQSVYVQGKSFFVRSRNDEAR